MKYLVYTLLFSLLLAFNGLGQVAKLKKDTIERNDRYWQFSLRGGLDLATKSKMPGSVKMPLKGYMAGLSIDKYWGFWGIGLDADLFRNDAPQYDSTGFSQQVSPWVVNSYTTSSTRLERYFAGIGPSFKYQTVNNHFTAELNLRGGVTRTDGSALYAQTIITGPTSSLSTPLFLHIGYQEVYHPAAKAQVRFSFFPGKRIGIQAGAYYLHQFDSEVPFQYAVFGAKPDDPVIVYQKTSLSSYGAFAGISYRLFDRKSKQVTSQAKPPVTIPVPVAVQPAAPLIIERDVIVHVKDEQTGQPLYHATVVMNGADGKEQTAHTDKQGIARFPKTLSADYVTMATLNDINSTKATITIADFNTTGSIERTLYHNDPRFTLVGKAVNKVTQYPEGSALATLTNETNNGVSQASSQSGTGEFRFQLERESDFSVVGKKAGYISNIERVSTKGLNRNQVLYVQIELGVEEATKGKKITLNNIYYDLNSAALRSDASSDLTKLLIFLRDNPALRIELAAHTDARGSDSHNMRLSQSRAQSVVNYLVNNGIARERMVAKGYGETQLMNRCANGVGCSEIEHQQNRRTEIKVLNE
jgi:outer membrane protein OmpA-like peptidoglycan-associated protein